MSKYSQHSASFASVAAPKNKPVSPQHDIRFLHNFDEDILRVNPKDELAPPRRNAPHLFIHNPDNDLTGTTSKGLPVPPRQDTPHPFLHNFDEDLAYLTSKGGPVPPRPRTPNPYSWTFDEGLADASQEVRTRAPPPTSVIRDRVAARSEYLRQPPYVNADIQRPVPRVHPKVSQLSPLVIKGTDIDLSDDDCKPYPIDMNDQTRSHISLRFSRAADYECVSDNEYASDNDLESCSSDASGETEISDMELGDYSTDDDASSVTLGSQDTSDSESESDMSLSDADSYNSSNLDVEELLDEIGPYPTRPSNNQMFHSVEDDLSPPPAKRFKHQHPSLLTRALPRGRYVGSSSSAQEDILLSPDRTFVTAGRDGTPDSDRYIDEEDNVLVEAAEDYTSGGFVGRYRPVLGIVDTTRRAAYYLSGPPIARIVRDYMLCLAVFVCVSLISPSYYFLYALFVISPSVTDLLLCVMPPQFARSRPEAEKSQARISPVRRAKKEWSARVMYHSSSHPLNYIVSHCSFQTCSVRLIPTAFLPRPTCPGVCTLAAGEDIEFYGEEPDLEDFVGARQVEEVVRFMESDDLAALGEHTFANGGHSEVQGRAKKQNVNLSSSKPHAKIPSGECSLARALVPNPPATTPPISTRLAVGSPEDVVASACLGLGRRNTYLTNFFHTPTDNTAPANDIVDTHHCYLLPWNTTSHHTVTAHSIPHTRLERQSTLVLLHHDGPSLLFPISSMLAMLPQLNTPTPIRRTFIPLPMEADVGLHSRQSAVLGEYCHIDTRHKSAERQTFRDGQEPMDWTRLNGHWANQELAFGSRDSLGTGECCRAALLPTFGLYPIDTTFLGSVRRL
ncbi:hypothetical protein NMY22_g15906 [Coprinellus aureogranulatus]|nr:hypothetical protein NMY22_g15906 [Coprinellus aureogranulatus]